MKPLYPRRSRDFLFSPCDHVCHYVAPAPVAIQLGVAFPGAQFIVIESLGAPVWFRFGAANTPVVEPVSDVTDGTAPDYLAGGSAAPYTLSSDSSTHLVLLSTGDVLVRGWS